MIAEVPIHFDTSDHRISLRTYDSTTQNVADVLSAFSTSYFSDELEYEIYVLPSEEGGFLTRLGVVFIAGWGALWSFTESEVGKDFIKGLTGENPSYWATVAGEKLRETTKGLLATGSPSDGEVARCAASEIIFSEMSRGFLRSPNRKLTEIGILPWNFREGFKAKNDFFATCIENREVNAVGFDDSNNFDIKRSDFADMRAILPESVRFDPLDSWNVEIAEVQVTSPNWNRMDRYRGWKGKDARNRDVYFEIGDEGFWHSAWKDSLNCIPSIQCVFNGRFSRAPAGIRTSGF